MTANNDCPNCGVEISETPEQDDLHPVQMRTPTEDADYCEACAFGGSTDDGSIIGYDHTGNQIVRASDVTASDEELAETLASLMGAEELRRFMSANGIKRSRGARKLESALQAVEQDRTLVAATTSRAFSERDPHVASCSCGYEERFADEEAAIEAARAHKSEHNTHFPRALADGEERIYG